MANTKTTTFSVRLKPATKKRLAKLSLQSGRSANYLVADAVESYLADQERLRSDLRLSDRQLKSGHYIPHDAMKAWLLSWGTKRELPPPKCACGKPHHDAP